MHVNRLMYLCFRKLRDKFKTVSRLLEAEEYEQLMASIKSKRLTAICRVCDVLPIVLCIDERQLKQRIAELSRYRRNGITKLEGEGMNE